MWCKSCEEGDVPHVLDIDGLRAANTGKEGVWAHAYEDDWWPCQRKAAEEHAIVGKLPKCWRLVDGKLVQDVPVVLGMDLFGLAVEWYGDHYAISEDDDGRIYHDHVDSIEHDAHNPCGAIVGLGSSGEFWANYCYSTSEAAEAALKQQQTESTEGENDGKTG